MPQLRFLWIWFGLTLLPAPLGAGAHVLNSGRFLYLPAIPLCLFLVHAIAVFGQRKEACDILLLAPVFALLILHWLNISWDTLFIEPTVCLMVWLAIVALTTILWGTKRPGAGITVWSGLALLLSAYLAVRPFGAFWPETAIAVTIWTAWCDRGEARLARAILVGVVMAQTPITSLIFVVAMLLCSIFYSSHRYEVAKQ